MRPMKGPLRDDCTTRSYSHTLLSRLAEHVIWLTRPCLLERPEVRILTADAEVAFVIRLIESEADPGSVSVMDLNEAYADVIDAWQDATMRHLEGRL